ncbi:MAG: glucose-6-phosphate isomerase [Clostridia bacterium]|jgi:glucose-6-phosphate isomerase|nr:glucose-6-phosphate isomerase [Clostridia bacterium]MBT7121739.1 glucose-6-phosphate isomerase [Clostridia bacterium]
MSGLVFDFNNAMAGMVSHGFEIQQSDEAMVAKAHSAMQEGQMGFRELPRGQEDILDDIIDTARDVSERFDNFVVLGIGGSALGPIAVYHALGQQSDINFFVEDNIDPERLNRTFGGLDLQKTMFNVVTKSGKTSETMAQMMTVAGMLEKAGLKLSDHMIATTDKENGNLALIARKEGLKTFILPSNVGGRFSELSPVGLLPAAVCGIDIRGLLQGAAHMDEVCSREQNNPAAMFALLHVMGMQRDMNISVMMPYADSLKFMSDWYAQIWAESLGKRVDNDGNEVFVGQTPVGALGVTDQHSQVQLYTEGPFDKIVTFLKVDKFASELKIPKAFEYVQDIAFLCGKSFSELMAAEQSATEYALCVADRPNISITLSEVDAFSIGALLYFFEMATAYAGEMMGINTFDQPGVEEGKLATFALMGKQGFEEKKAQMDALSKKQDKWIMQ